MARVRATKTERWMKRMRGACPICLREPCSGCGYKTLILTACEALTAQSPWHASPSL